MTSRFVGEMAIAALGFAACLTTLLWRNWVESAFRVDPDHGSGAAEWAIVIATLSISITASVAARSQWRRAHAEDH